MIESYAPEDEFVVNVVLELSIVILLEQNTIDELFQATSVLLKVTNP
eukprot:CAMPEP_0170956522 /NCGR_PEP_ID=MMETSP0735-20130129/34044_1 /TAXON_ID=186038 /ORGANISM="Fragilariopsis kerguelensis, Strain L26-C5" /LENGTH=46 /DNA_ID= /DNA_START= /DNA_END= /DNA_ORIENTATION=